MRESRLSANEHFDLVSKAIHSIQLIDETCALRAFLKRVLAYLLCDVKQQLTVSGSTQLTIMSLVCQS